MQVLLERLWSRQLSRNGSISFGHVALYATVADGRFVVLRVSTTNVTVFRCEPGQFGRRFRRNMLSPF